MRWRARRWIDRRDRILERLQRLGRGAALRLGLAVELREGDQASCEDRDEHRCRAHAEPMPRDEATGNVDVRWRPGQDGKPPEMAPEVRGDVAG